MSDNTIDIINNEAGEVKSFLRQTCNEDCDECELKTFCNKEIDNIIVSEE